MKTDTPTHAEKLQAFDDPDNSPWHAYFNVTPVCTAWWTTEDWIKTVKIWKRKVIP